MRGITRRATLVTIAVALFIACGSKTTPPGPQPSNTLGINPTAQSAGAEGGTFSATVSSNTSWTASAGAAWLTITSGGSGNGNGTINYTAAANAGAARTAQLTASGGGLNATLTVTQAAAAGPPSPSATLTVSTTVQRVAPGGESRTVDVASNVAWSASSNSSWLTITSGASGNGNGTVAFTAVANPGAGRTGPITVTGGGLTATVSVPQDAVSAASLTLNPTSQTVAAGGETRSVAVTTTVAWTAVSDSTWLTITAGASGSNNGTVTYAAAANNTGSARSGTITVSGGGATATHTVQQPAVVAPPPPAPVINPTSNSPTTAGGAFTAAVTATGAWTAASNQPWLTITSGASGSGNGTLGYSVAVNAGGARTGTITVTGAGGTATMTVSQAGVVPFAANFTWSTDAGACDLETGGAATVVNCTFDASSSTSPTPITNYRWDFSTLPGGDASGRIVNRTTPTVTGIVLGCGVPATFLAARDVTLTITNSAGTTSVTKSVLFRRDSGC